MYRVIFILFSLIGLSIGSFLMTNPLACIEIQRRFYATINWKIEPVSNELEIRNTRIMGGFLIVLSVVTLVLAFIKI